MSGALVITRLWSGEKIFAGSMQVAAPRLPITHTLPSPLGDTTRPRPFLAPRYTVSTMSINSCLSFMAQLILLLFPVPKSIMMCCSNGAEDGVGVKTGSGTCKDTLQSWSDRKNNIGCLRRVDKVLMAVCEHTQRSAS